MILPKDKIMSKAISQSNILIKDHKKQGPMVPVLRALLSLLPTLQQVSPNSAILVSGESLMQINDIKCHAS